MEIPEQIDLIEKAMEKIRGHFTTQVCARNAAGEQVDPSDSSACMFCAIGALVVASDNRDQIYEFPTQVMCSIAVANGGHSDSFNYISRLNDTQGEAAVLQMFENTLAYLRRAEATSVSADGPS